MVGVLEMSVASTLTHLRPAMGFKRHDHFVDFLCHMLLSDGSVAA
jgi:hypothetical protein